MQVLSVPVILRHFGFLAVKSWERLLAKYENSTEKNRTTYKTFLKKRYLSIAPIYILFILFYQIISYYIATFNVEPFYKYRIIH